jgi:pheromone shutdown protein TraB
VFSSSLATRNTGQKAAPFFLSFFLSLALLSAAGSTCVAAAWKETGVNLVVCWLTSRHTAAVAASNKTQDQEQEEEKEKKKSDEDE